MNSSPEVISRMSVLDQQEREAYELVKAAEALLALANENWEATCTERRLFMQRYTVNQSGGRCVA